MGNFETVRLGDVATYINGYAFKPSYWSDNGLPIIRIQNLTGNDYETNYYSGDYNKKYEVVNGDILISWSASLGVYEWKNEKALLNQHIFKVVFDKLPIDKSYFVHTVSYLLNDMLKETHGSTMKHITKPRFDNTAFPYPPLETQKQIAATLDKVTHTIDTCNAILEKLDLLVKSRFIEVFGSITKRRKLEEYADLITKGASPKWQGIDYAEEGTLFVTSENVRKGYLDFTKKKYLPNDINKILPRSVLKRNDILINIVNASIGRVAVYDSDELANINQAVALVRLKPNALNITFLLTFLNSEEALRAYDFMKVGGDKANLSLKNISDLLIPVADLELQEKFATFVEQIDKSKLAVKQVLEKAETLKKALMQEYFG